MIVNNRCHSTLIVLTVSMLGCADVDAPASSLEREESESSALSEVTDDWLMELVDDYLYKQAADAEKESIRQRIRSLDRQTTRRFRELLIERSGLTGNEKRGAEIAYEYAEEQGFSFLDGRDGEHSKALKARLLTRLTQSEGSTAIEKSACSIGQATCDFVTWWNYGMTYAPSCTSGCVVGTLYDRTGNEACEWGACDYRVRFTKTNATRIAGTTAAGDCVAQYYGSIGAYSGAPYTYGIFGQAGIILCGLPTGVIHTQFQVF
jgi:hypothetical protein